MSKNVRQQSKNNCQKNVSSKKKLIKKKSCFCLLPILIECHDYNYPHDDIHRARARTQATTHCTSWRSDGPPSCLGVSSHWWFNTHSTLVPERGGCVWFNNPKPTTATHHNDVWRAQANNESTVHTARFSQTK